MISNKDPKLAERLNKIWQEAQERIAERQARAGGIGYVDLSHVQIETDALKIVPEERAKEVKAAVFEKRAQSVALAALSPLSPETQRLIRELNAQNYIVKVFMVSPKSLEYAMSFYQYIPKNVSEITSRLDIEEKKVLELQKELTTLKKVTEMLDVFWQKEQSTGVILEAILAGALTNRASDVHFEPTKELSRLRYRIDGVLMDISTDIPAESYRLLISRIKLLSGVRINITTVAQDGRFTVELGDVPIELRVSTIPSEFGETIVMRILDPRAIQVDVRNLGLRPDDLAIVEEQLKAPNGMILNTGPTGSGKTTTLYAFLQKIANPEIKIITIEDPIEYHLRGIEQTQVDPKAGYTFSNGLQAIMRQDPDVILVGEIRDKDTAGIAIQASLTGHLVFSTLHTNSASGVIPRLLDLEAPLTSIGPALNLAIAQRLVRRLCEHCKKPVALTPATAAHIEKFITSLPARVSRGIYKAPMLFTAGGAEQAKGCEKCQFTGYYGRIAIFELLITDDSIEELIRNHAGEAEVAKFAKDQGMVTLQQDGILKALQGMTSLAEVESVTGSLKVQIVE